ncbi:corticotropin-releasing factor-binding protein [Arctopsyche grandis]|uniref:corticotropin-releasing factor-binding protein n=1 Tax=Arctopsyche grandis TaxID=121162 RepID=UPI00406D7EE9
MRAAVALLLNFNVALFFATGHSAYQNTFPSSSRRIAHSTPEISPIYRARRESTSMEYHIINSKEDCMLVTSDEGQFFYKSTDDESTVCGIYMITDPGKRIEMIIVYMDVPCEAEGLIAWIDGWELNGQFFPSPRDHPLPEDDRFAEMCGNQRVKRVFVSNQNAALLQYRVPMKGKGFSIIVRHVKNPNPCNVLLTGADDMYTLRNYGRPVNCSISAIYPASVRFVAISVSVAKSTNRHQIETGTIHKCEKRGLPDYVEVGGSPGLDNVNMERAISVCGIDSIPAKSVLSLLCDVTTVRLVSGGQFDNSVTVEVKKLDLDEMMQANFSCNV